MRRLYAFVLTQSVTTKPFIVMYRVWLWAGLKHLVDLLLHLLHIIRGIDPNAVKPAVVISRQTRNVNSDF